MIVDIYGIIGDTCGIIGDIVGFSGIYWHTATTKVTIGGLRP